MSSRVCFFPPFFMVAVMAQCMQLIMIMYRLEHPKLCLHRIHEIILK